MQAKPSATIPALCVVLLPLVGCGSMGGRPDVVVRDASRVELPGVPPKGDPKLPGGEFDCNNAVHWNGSTMYVFSSTGHPWRAAGPDLFHLSRPSLRVEFDNEKPWNESKQGARWIEATYKVEGGPLYMWYHNEPPAVCTNAPHLTIPRIGAMVSDDNGLNWRDLGIVLEAPADSRHCGTANRYFAGGNGDFSVILDREKQHFHFLISTYNKDVAEQGVAIARMRYADRDAPVGKVWKWYKGTWNEPGLGGHVSPIFVPVIDWHRPDADAFWGPSVHWNTYLGRYVMLLNRAKDKEWAQEGIYVSFAQDIRDPRGWMAPKKILDAPALEKSRWYPQVVGSDSTRHETDKLAGRVARLFVTGLSKWEIVFLRAGEAAGRTNER